MTFDPTILIACPRSSCWEAQTDVSPMSPSRPATPWSVPRMGRGLAVGDLDNDGREDVLILAHNQPLAYFHNRTHGGRFLTLRLESGQSNRDAVGAKVAITVGNRRCVAQRVGGGSYQSASEPRLRFGLGESDLVDLIEVSWPSGRLDRYQHVRADAGYLLREGESRPRPLRGFQEVAIPPSVR